MTHAEKLEALRQAQDDLTAQQNIILNAQKEVTALTANLPAYKRDRLRAAFQNLAAALAAAAAALAEINRIQALIAWQQHEQKLQTPTPTPTPIKTPWIIR